MHQPFVLSSISDPNLVLNAVIGGSSLTAVPRSRADNRLRAREEYCAGRVDETFPQYVRGDLDILRFAGRALFASYINSYEFLRPQIFPCRGTVIHGAVLEELLECLEAQPGALAENYRRQRNDPEWIDTLRNFVITLRLSENKVRSKVELLVRDIIRRAEPGHSNSTCCTIEQEVVVSAGGLIAKRNPNARDFQLDTAAGYSGKIDSAFYYGDHYPDSPQYNACSPDQHGGRIFMINEYKQYTADTTQPWFAQMGHGSEAAQALVAMIGARADFAGVIFNGQYQFLFKKLENPEVPGVYKLMCYPGNGNPGSLAQDAERINSVFTEIARISAKPLPQQQQTSSLISVCSVSTNTASLSSNASYIQPEVQDRKKTKISLRADDGELFEVTAIHLSEEEKAEIYKEYRLDKERQEQQEYLDN